MSSLPVGTKLRNGNFTVGKVLGQGGYGITYLGNDTELHRLVAIKEFFPAGCFRQNNRVQLASGLTPDAFEIAKRKFLDEARALAQFRHEGIVQVYTRFEENNTAYMVMEFLRGQTLGDIIQQRRTLPQDEAVEYVRKVGVALEKVHAANILHRDIKPDNIMVCSDGRIVLLDFGLSKFLEDSNDFHTRKLTTFVALSPGYAPPEQYGNRVPMGLPSDIYALGGSLYYLLTGEVPVDARERKMHDVPLPAPHNLKPAISRGVSDVVMKALELRPELRYQSVPEFLKALAAAPHARPTPVAVQTPVTTNGTAPPPLVPQPQLSVPAPLPATVASPVPSFAGAQHAGNGVSSPPAYRPPTPQPALPRPPVAYPVANPQRKAGPPQKRVFFGPPPPFAYRKINAERCVMEGGAIGVLVYALVVCLLFKLNFNLVGYRVNYYFSHPDNVALTFTNSVCAAIILGLCIGTIVSYTNFKERNAFSSLMTGGLTGSIGGAIAAYFVVYNSIFSSIVQMDVETPALVIGTIAGALGGIIIGLIIFWRSAAWTA